MGFINGYETYLKDLRWAVKLRIKHAPNFLNRFRPVPPFGFIEGVRNVSGDVCQEDSPDSSLAIAPAIHIEATVQSPMCRPCSEHFACILVRASTRRNDQFIEH